MNWIKCSERLPDIGEKVLIEDYHREHYVMEFNGKGFFEYNHIPRGPGESEEEQFFERHLSEIKQWCEIEKPNEMD